MEKTPSGTAVGVDDPYAHVERCDHLTDDGRCRYALEHPEADRGFAAARRAEEYACPVVNPEREASSEASGGRGGRTRDWAWADCPHFRSRAHNRECARCGVAERRMAHTDERPLLEEHHLSYHDSEELTHEITVYLCRWCHAKVHSSWARVDDDASPDPAALAAAESRRAREQAEFGFEAASERYDREE